MVDYIHLSYWIVYHIDFVFGVTLLSPSLHPTYLVLCILYSIVVLSFHFLSLGVEIPKFVDTVTPQYKPKFDALVSIDKTFFSFLFLSLCANLLLMAPSYLVCLLLSLSFHTWFVIYDSCLLQLVELKEAEEKSLKESERLEKEIVEVQELKVLKIIP